MRHTEDTGVTAILGTILMLALMLTLAPGVILLRAAVSDEMSAHREAAERAAWCARHPDIGFPDCPARGPMPGYSCAEVEVEVWVCQRLPSLNETPLAPVTNATTLAPVTNATTLESVTNLTTLAPVTNVTL